MTREVAIWSYFSKPTDLASEMQHWQEFISGEGYAVDLRDSVTGELVTIRFVEEWEDCYVIISSPSLNELFDRVVGKVIYALAANSDYLHVKRERVSSNS
jgi:hypothetical protein